jgi:hypothetical protein
MNKTLVIVGVLLAVAMMSAVLVVLPTQEVDARTSLKVIQKQTNKCRNAGCSNSGSISINIQ